MRKMYVVGVLLIVCFTIGSTMGGVSFAQPKTTITFAGWQFLEAGRKEVLMDFVKEFEAENPDVKINIEAVPYRTYADKLTTEFGAGTGPDIFKIQGFMLVPWIKMGVLQPLEEYIDLSKYEPHYMMPQQKLGIVNGKTYAVIRTGFAYAGLNYNKKIFEKAGMTVPKTPEELISTSKKLANSDLATFGLIHPTNFANYSYIMQGGMIVIRGFGGFLGRNGHPTVAERQFIEGVRYLKRLYDEGGIPHGLDFSRQREVYIRGKAAMVLDGSYWPTVVKAANPDLYPYNGVAPLPFPCKYSPFETNWYGINKAVSPERKKAAAKFFELLYRPKNMIKWSLVVASPGMDYTYAPLLKEYPWFKVYQDAAPFGVVKAVQGLEEYTEMIRKMTSDAIAEVCIKNVPPEKAMKDLQERIENYIKAQR